MPFFKKNTRVINFVHIPKTGGSSVLSLLKSNGWEKITTPSVKTGHPHKLQYLPISDSLKPEFEFCVVRDPLERFISAVYQIMRGLKELDELNNLFFDNSRYELNNDKIVIFAHKLFTKIFIERGIYCDDHKWLPQSYFISKDTKVFIFSNLKAMIAELIDQEIIDKSSNLEKINVNPKKNILKPNWELSPDTENYFLNFYKIMKFYRIILFYYKVIANKWILIL